MYKTYHLEEFNMGIAKRKKSLSIYNTNKGMSRREELLKQLTQNQTKLPQSILHDDLDRGFLDYVKSRYTIVSDGLQIPIIERIMTIQRWGEFTQNWSFSDDDGNIEVPFIAIIRNPEVTYGTHPSNAFNVPQQALWYYATVQTWNGTTAGADVYRIPQPVPVDIKYEVTIVCTKFRDLNAMNKVVLENLSSMQDYQIVNGHYIPVFLEGVTDTSPINTVENRRFYVQTYKFTMNGYILDSEKFEVSPAVNRALLFFETPNEGSKKEINQVANLDITTVTFSSDGVDTVYNVNENIGILITVKINGLTQEQNTDYFFIGGSSRITFSDAPLNGSVVTVTYIKNANTTLMDPFGNVLLVNKEYFTYTGGTPTFEISNPIKAMLSFDVNGLEETENLGYQLLDATHINLFDEPIINSKIGVIYIS